jgi:hypothetical protein
MVRFRGPCIFESDLNQTGTALKEFSSSLEPAVDLAFVAELARRDHLMEAAQLRMRRHLLVRLVLELPAIDAVGRRHERATRIP